MARVGNGAGACRALATPCSVYTALHGAFPRFTPCPGRAFANAALTLLLAVGAVAPIPASAQDWGRKAPLPPPVENAHEAPADAASRAADSAAYRFRDEAPSRAADSAAYQFREEGFVVVKAQEDYAGGRVRRWLLGDDYRDVWTMPLEVPVIDLQRTAGGLTPVESGGERQSTTLHLIGADGHQYILRSVDKTTDRSTPVGFRGTFLQSLLQDQISSLNPIGSEVIPPLARAAGILHTRPTLVVIPDSPRLGEFREAYAGMLAHFERKPDEDQSDVPNFGHSENIVGSTKLFEKLLEDNDNHVDERAYARARLFDMLIGDLDRHEDQWRWAEFDSKHGTRFVPVPRDRDFAFAKYDGVIPALARMSGAALTWRLVNFNERMPNVVGMNWLGSALDRRLTASLTRDDWLEIADGLARALPDEVIDAAIRTWPEAVVDEIGPKTIRALKARRDQLSRMASDYYEKLATRVDVVGSNMHERFEVTRLEGGRTRVIVYKTNEDGEVSHELFHRVFLRDETDEVRLFALDGKDTFVIDGAPDLRPRVRRIDGPDTYEMARLDFHAGGPFTSLDYRSRNGIVLGAGAYFTRIGFRRDPYAAQHRLGLTYAPRTRAYNAFYDGHVVDWWKRLDLHLAADALAEFDFRDFYGLGNETPSDNRLRFRAQLRRVTAKPSLRLNFGPASYVDFGPFAEVVSVEPPSEVGGAEVETGFTPDDFTDKYYAGVRSSFALDSRDTLLNPHRGLYWLTQAELSSGVRNTRDRMARLASDLRFYYTLPLPGQFTIALRAGGATSIGEFTFYQSHTLGGSDNLRGYPRTRFAGRTAVFTNAELRAKLLDWNVYVTKGELGLFGFVDHGRVWTDGEESDRWHRGYGAGLWVTPFHLAVITGAMTYSEFGSAIDVTFGFQF